MSSSAAPAHQPAPSPSGRISLLFDVIDTASISYADAVHAIAQQHGSALPPPPHWSHKGTARAGIMLSAQHSCDVISHSLAGFFSSIWRSASKQPVQARASLDSQVSSTPLTLRRASPFLLGPSNAATPPPPCFGFICRPHPAVTRACRRAYRSQF